MKQSHKKRVENSIRTVLPKMARVLKYSEDHYTNYKYELAYKWLNDLGFEPKTIRILVVSSTYQKWWNERIHQIEKSFLKTLKTNESLKNKRDRFETMVLLLEAWPSDLLLEEIQAEATEILSRRKDLLNMNTNSIA